MKLNTSAATSSQPPDTRAAARVRSVRPDRRDTHSMTPKAMTAAGISQATCPPIRAASRRVRWTRRRALRRRSATAATRRLARAASLPRTIPGRSPNAPPSHAQRPARAAGSAPVTGEPAQAVVAEREVKNAVVGGASHVGTVRGRGEQVDRYPPPGGEHQRTAPISSCQIRLPSLGWPADQVGEGNAGSTRNAWSILARYPSPRKAPARAIHRVRPDSMARVVAYAARAS